MTKRGPLGAPVLINAGRGGLQNEADILAALDEELLSAVTLDVFQQEPLDPESPFWAHPKVTITPHAAAASMPSSLISTDGGTDRCLRARRAAAQPGGPQGRAIEPAYGLR
jgi:phosphoglycerate dehydrogenase-like enzyme